MRFSVAQVSFGAGFLGKKYRNKTGSPVYRRALDNGLNMLVTSQGCLLRRPSTQILTNASNDTVNAISRQIAFAYTDSLSYRFVFESNKVSIYDNSDALVFTITSSGITGTQVTEFSYDQGRDRLIICHPTFGFKAITRDNLGAFSIANVVIEDGPYENLNIDSQKKLKPLTTSGVSAFTAFLKDDVTPITDFFKASDVGRLYRIRHSPSSGSLAGVTKWGNARVTNVISPPNQTAVTLIPSEYELGGVAGTKNWRAGVWYPGFFPSDIAFGRGRLWGINGDRVFGSFQNNFDRFSPTTENALNNDDGHLVTDECAVDVQITNLKGEKIHWIYEDDVIHLGGENGHYVLQGSSLLGAITPNTVSIVKQSSEGCADIRPISMGGLVYVHESRKKLILSARDLRTDFYNTTDLNALADTILDGRVKKLVKISYPWMMIWAILENGDLACFSYEENNQVAAWSLHRLATGQVEDACVIKDPNGLDKIYFTVLQHNGERRVEKMSDFVIKEDAHRSDFIVLDGAYSFESTAPIGTIPNLDRFNGKEVFVIKDGTVVQKTVVSGGNLTLNNISGDIYLGLNPQVYLETLNIESISEEQSTIGKKKQASRVDINLYDTLQIEIKQVRPGATLQEIPLRTVDSPTETAPDLFTGIPRQITVRQESTSELRFRIEQTKPAPLAISELTYQLEVTG